ncbi:MAG TPA: TorF family putative porin, partial [Gammaproteobacteria bacterium]|nr:TorF family putative porin [Gammaproteobacteria bacterium]
MRRFICATFALACAVACAAPARAETAPALFTGYVAFMSNYIGRGLAQSVGQPSVQAELDYNNSGGGFYAGLDGTSINWIDQVYPGDSVAVELDGYAGYRKLAGDWTFKAGVLRLQFPGRYVAQSPPAARPDTTELFASAAWRNLSAKLNYSVTDAFGTPDSRGSWYLDLAAELPIAGHWRVGAHLGRKQSRGTNPATGVPNSRSSYTDYRLAATYLFDA